MKKTVKKIGLSVKRLEYLLKKGRRTALEISKRLKVSLPTATRYLRGVKGVRRSSRRDGRRGPKSVAFFLP